MMESSIVYDGTHYRSHSKGGCSERYQLHTLPIHDYTFINFLAIAQDLYLDFVPIVWQSVLDNSDESRAEVNESLMTVQHSFVFKCVMPKVRYSDNERRQIYRELIAEISVLGLSTATQHPYLARLEGVSWDIKSDGEVWPVLMSEKTKHGSLAKLVVSKEGQSLTVIQKLKLFTETALAIRDLHSWGIIHGDIKPSNVLVFESPVGVFSARVTDFGYSSKKQIDDYIYLPRSIPWNHPRLHSRAYTFHDAACTDVYSLGLLCFWMFFNEDKNYPIDKTLTTLKLEGRMPEVVKGFRDTFTSFNEGESNILSSIFDMTLIDDDHKRSSILELTGALQKWWLNTDDSCLGKFQTPELAPVEPVEIDIQIARDLHQLYLLDPRVRKFIARSLQEDVDQVGKQEAGRPAPKAAFHLALCYSLGFGVRRDDSLARHFLVISGRPAAELTEEIKLAKTESDLRFRSSKFQSLWDDGYITFDNAAKLVSRQDLLEVSQAYRQEVRDYGATLGEFHPFTVDLRLALGSTLFKMGEWAEAKHLCEKVVCQTQQIYGERHEHTLLALALLATTTTVMGLWDEAEKIEKSLLQLHSVTKGLQHPETLETISGLAQVFSLQGKWADACEMASEYVTRQTAILGEKHPRTLNGQSKLIEILTNQGQWEQAKALVDELIETSSKVRGSHHPDTLRCQMQLGILYYKMGSFDEAMELETGTLETAEDTLGPEHPETIRLSINLASTMAAVGEYEEAETLLNKVLPVAIASLGPDHDLVMDAWGTTSLLYKEQGRMGEAAEVDLKKLRISQEKFGKSHYLTLQAMAELASAYSKDDTRLDEAKDLLEDVITQRMQMLGPKHDDTLASQQTLATVFARSGELSKACALQEQILETRKECFGMTHESTCVAMSELASTYWELRDISRALDLEKEALDCCRRGIGDGKPVTIGIMNRLAMTYTHLHNWEAARPLAEEALALSLENWGSGHSESWSIMDTVAEIDLGEGRFQDALDRWEELLAFQLEDLPEDHESVIDTKDSIEKTKKMMAGKSESL